MSPAIFSNALGSSQLFLERSMTAKVLIDAEFLRVARIYAI